MDFWDFFNLVGFFLMSAATIIYCLYMLFLYEPPDEHIEESLEIKQKEAS